MNLMHLALVISLFLYAVQGQQYRIGDIVSVRGTDLCVYYAQIKGLMIDEYCEKSVSITWLLPTQTKSAFTREGFDPMTYIIGN